MKRGTPEHPKVMMLASRLGIPLYAAVGILETLWHFTARYTPRGDIGRYSNEIIARKIDWTGKSQDLIDALVKERLLDEVEPYRLVVHDWSDHSDDSCDKYLAVHGMTYYDGSKPRRGKKIGKAGKVRTSLDKSRLSSDLSGKVRKSPEKSRLSEPEPEPEPESEPHSEEEAAERVRNGDSAHRIMKERTELSLLTYEQDLMARKCFAGMSPAPDWEEVARYVAERAVLAGNIAQPGSWLRAQYARYCEKNTAVPVAIEKPRERMFRSEAPCTSN